MSKRELSRNALCWCGSGRKWKQCHWPQANPQKSTELKGSGLDPATIARRHRIVLKTPDEIAAIRKASYVTALVLDELCRAAKVGVTTRQLDQLAAKLYHQHGSTAATLGYGDPPWPAHICTSINEVICHGIPDDRPLQEGDILNIDVSAVVDGYFGDASRMVCIGEVSPEKANVVQASYEALERAIAVCKPGVPIHAIGDAIEATAAAHRCSVVYQFVGHGVGIRFHEPPEIPHHRNQSQIPMLPGMIFTIEPMLNAGKPEAVIDPHDGWTARTVDRRPSAQWEHTLLITDDGCEVLTKL